MSNLVKRKCSSEKECNDCGRTILIDEYYYVNPNKCLCEKCRANEKEVVKEITTQVNNKSDGYSVNEKCEFCEAKAVGTMNGHYTCADQDHIDQALGITIET